MLKPWPDLKDRGVGAVSKIPAEDYYFKVASLRNIAETAPYFHDGSVERLRDAIRMMARHQLAKELDDAQVESIHTWLLCLTGKLPAIRDLGTPIK